MKAKKFLFSAVAALSLFGFGCSTTTSRVDVGSQGITTLNDVNARDWQDVSAKAVESLLASGVLARSDGRKSIVMISEVKNNTNTAIRTQILTSKMRQAMLASGKAVVTTAVGANGAEDNATRQVRDLENDDIFNQQTVQKRGTVLAPDMSLSGEIVSQSATEGRLSENAFYFHVVVTDLSTGLAVWEETFDLAKQSQTTFLGL